MGEEDEGEHDDVVLRAVETNLLTETALRGIPAITKVTIREQKQQRFIPGQGFKSITEWELDTVGVSMLEVMSKEGVDATRIQSNFLPEV